MDKTVSVKTHLIVTDIHEEYNINWCGRIIDSNPVLKNGMPIFVVAGSNGRMELNTIDMKLIEKWGKKMTYPRGRKAVTTDKSYIYIKEVNGNEKLVCVVTHNHIKKYASMYDRVGYR